MGFIIYGIISFLMIGLSYLSNIRKLTDTRGKIILLSTLEGFITAGLIYLVFLPGIFRYFIDVLIVIFIVSIIIFIYTLLVKGRNADWDLQNENIKNNLILFALSVLPFLLTMTILRYTNPFIQVFISITSSVFVLSLHIFIQKKCKKFFARIKTRLEMMSDMNYVFIYIVIALFVASPLIFQTPAYPLKQTMNLEDTAAYYSFADYPFDYNIDFETSVLFETEFELDKSQLILDYMIEDSLLYMFTDYNMYIYNMETNDLEKTCLKS